MAKVQKVEIRDYEHRAFSIRYVIAFFVFFGFLISGVLVVYGFLFGHWYREPMLFLSRIFLIPAIRVEDETIIYYDIARLARVAEWQGRDVPFDDAMETMIDRTLMKRLATEIGTGISQEDLEAYKVDQEDIQVLLEAVNWTVDDYRKYVVEPLLLYQAVEKGIVHAQDQQSIALAEMESIVENIELGVSFSDLARQYSDHSSSISGGDLGYIERSDFAEGMEDIFDLGIGEVTSILEWNGYFVVAQVYDVVQVEGDRSMVGVRMIAIEKNDLSVIFNQYKKNADVQFLLW